MCQTSNVFYLRRFPRPPDEARGDVARAARGNAAGKSELFFIPYVFTSLRAEKRVLISFVDALQRQMG